MFKDEKILALIPARGGSKGIKNKNIVELCGKPLLAYTTEAAKKSRHIDKILVSTDSRKIADVAESFGADVPFMRPAEISLDTTPTLDVVIHAINWLKEAGDIYDTLVLLQPTGPLRTAEDIDAAIESYFVHGEKALVSVSIVNDHPILIRSIGDGNILKPLLSNTSSTVRRQDMPKYYKVNGCIYINKISEITAGTNLNDNPLAFVMSPEHSIDIDEPADLWLARYYIEMHPDSIDAGS